MKTPKVLRNALEDAEILLTYASRNGVDVDNQCVTGVTKAVSELLNDSDAKMSAEEQAEFYANYRILAKTMSPVTAGSIRDSDDSFSEPRKAFIWWGKSVHRAPASGAVVFFSTQTFIALGLLLYLQVIWAFGNTLLEKLAVSTAQFAKAKVEMGKPTDSTGSTTAALENTAAEIQSLYRLISKWRDTVPLPKEKLDTPSVDPREAWQDTAVAGQLRASAENLVTLLQIYFLPLLYGWLGACCYVLRQLIQEIRTRTYRSAMDRALLIRVVLGVVAGLSIGWFFRPNSGENANAYVTPLALSFLAGYSVEVLFSAMDRFISAFGSLSQTAKS